MKINDEKKSAIKSFFSSSPSRISTANKFSYSISFTLLSLLYLIFAYIKSFLIKVNSLNITLLSFVIADKYKKSFESIRLKRQMFIFYLMIGG